MSRDWKLWLIDTGERLVKTFVQAFAGSLVVTGWDDVKAALAIAASAGVLAVLMAVAGKQVGSPSSAALLPRRLDPPPPDEVAGSAPA